MVVVTVIMVVVEVDAVMIIVQGCYGLGSGCDGC